MARTAGREGDRGYAGIAHGGGTARNCLYGGKFPLVVPTWVHRERHAGVGEGKLIRASSHHTLLYERAGPGDGVAGRISSPNAQKVGTAFPSVELTYIYGISGIPPRCFRISCCNLRTIIPRAFAWFSGARRRPKVLEFTMLFLIRPIQ